MLNKKYSVETFESDTNAGLTRKINEFIDKQPYGFLPINTSISTVLDYEKKIVFYGILLFENERI